MVKELHNLIHLYYPLQDGSYIQNYNTDILIFEKGICIKIKHRALKHIVEKRKQDNYSEEMLKTLFSDLQSILANNNFKIIKNSTENGTFLLLELVIEKTSGVVLVLEIVQESANIYYIKTGFYRAAKKIQKLYQ